LLILLGRTAEAATAYEMAIGLSTRKRLRDYLSDRLRSLRET
jgi:predicted RNA polymerase sigma factor